MGEHIMWTEQEKGALVDAGAAYLFTHPGKTLLRALEEAQKQVLHGDRHRQVASITTVKWFKDGVLAKQGKPPEIIKVVEVEVHTPVTISDFSDEAIALEYTRRFVVAPAEKRSAQETKQALPAMVSAEYHRDKHRKHEQEEKKEAEPRLRKVAIATLKSVQEQALQKEFAGVFEINAPLEPRPSEWRKLAKEADIVIILIGFVHHTLQDIIKDLKYHRLGGGMSGVSAFLNNILDKETKV